MLDEDTFLTVLYVMSDDFCKEYLPLQARRPGPSAGLSPSEVITLALFEQFWMFRSERDFYGYAQRHLKRAFPTLPSRPQYNRQVRRQWQSIVAFCQHLQALLQARQCAFEVLDTLPVPVRNAQRRGEGWLAGMANIGWSTHLGWFEGFRLLLAVNPSGVITGFAFGPGSAKDQRLTEDFLALRRFPQAKLPTVGKPALGPYLADNGFEGAPNYGHWLESYGAQVLAKPKPSDYDAWPKEYRHWFSGLRQIVETIYDKLVNWLHLWTRKPHDLTGFQVQLAAKVTLHNFCIWLNGQLGRPPLAFADLLDW